MVFVFFRGGNIMKTIKDYRIFLSIFFLAGVLIFIPQLAQANSIYFNNVSFVDKDPDEGEISGTLTLQIYGDSDTEHVEKYLVEFFDYSGASPVLAEITPNDQHTYTYEIPENTKIPDRAVHLVTSGLSLDGDTIFGGQITTFADNILNENLPSIDLPAPYDLGWHDMSDDGRLDASISANKEDDRNDITHFVYYFHDKEGNKIKQIGQVPFKMNWNLNSYSLPATLAIPEEADAVAVYSRSDEGESKDYIAAGLWNQPAANPQKLQFLDEDIEDGFISGTLTWDKPKDESHTNRYAIYVMEEKNSWSGGTLLGKVEATGKEKYEFPIPQGTASGKQLEVRVEHTGDTSYWIPRGILVFEDKTKEAIQPRTISTDQLDFNYYETYYSGWNLFVHVERGLKAGDTVKVYQEDGTLLAESEKSPGGSAIVSLEEIPGLEKIYVSVVNPWGIEGGKTEVKLFNPSPALTSEQIEITEESLIISAIETADEVTIYDGETEDFLMGKTSFEEDVKQLVFNLTEIGANRKSILVSLTKAGMTEGPKLLVNLSQETFLTGWLQQNGLWSFFNKNGQKQTGWLKDAGEWYFFNNDGVMQTGWLKSGGEWYYLAGSGAMKTGWVQSGKEWYFMEDSGKMETGWIKSGGKWYYLASSGSMLTGWLSSGNTWYYLQPSGSMATGWKELNDKWYYFYSSGKMASNTTISGYKIGKGGTWIQ
jgi:glucan-binding YG repeat protein